MGLPKSRVMGFLILMPNVSKHIDKYRNLVWCEITRIGTLTSSRAVEHENENSGVDKLRAETSLIGMIRPVHLNKMQMVHNPYEK